MSADNGWSAMSLDPWLLDHLVCPVTRTPLRYDEAAQELVSEAAGVAYPDPRRSAGHADRGGAAFNGGMNTGLPRHGAATECESAHHRAVSATFASVHVRPRPIVARR